MQEESPKYLDCKLETDRKLFFRYFHSYKRAYHDLFWVLDECAMLIRNHEYTSYNDWQLNETLFNYAETLISTLNWLFREKKKDYPFVHQFLREWRNEYHHQSKNDFIIYDFKIQIDDTPYTFSNDFFVLPVISLTGRLKQLMEKWFDSENIATNATVNGLVKHHHYFMLKSLTDYENGLREKMPQKFLVSSLIYKRFMGGGKFSKFFSEDEFWMQAKKVTVNQKSK